MKIFIASDFHGKDPTNLVKTLANKNLIQKAVFLGDYDEVSILKNIWNLEIKKLILIGNHEYEFARKSNKVGFIDGVTKMQYWKMWGNTQAGNFARNGPKRIEEKLFNKKIIYLHGSLVDACESETPSEIWGRLHDFHQYGFTHERRIECNFNEMKKNDYWIMFRGHDHKQEIYSTKRDKYLGHYSQIKKTSQDTLLNKEDMNIISVGPFEENQYCIFNDETLELKFKEF